jgi:hypothetical protein
MKAAACWFADHWSVRTCALGSGSLTPSQGPGTEDSRQTATACPTRGLAGETSAERARRAFATVAEEIAALRKLTTAELEAKHPAIFGVASPIRTREALVKRISLALQRRAEAP